jgi:hypothetical protein
MTDNKKVTQKLEVKTIINQEYLSMVSLEKLKS